MRVKGDTAKGVGIKGDKEKRDEGKQMCGKNGERGTNG